MSKSIPGGPDSPGRKQVTGGPAGRKPPDRRPQTKPPGFTKKNGGAAGKAPRNTRPGH